MNLLRKTRLRESQPHQHATNEEFCRLFTKELKGLYLLSLLLTADSKLAEECVLRSLDDCMNGVAVAVDWAHSWAKRAVIKNAIRLVGPDLHSTVTNMEEKEAQECNREHPAISAILALRAFERIVLVTCVLEWHSDRDSASLLGCVAQAIREARVQALRHIAGV
jgi:hypothetical protein